MLTDAERRKLDRLPAAARDRAIRLTLANDATAEAVRGLAARTRDLRESIRGEEDKLSRLLSSRNAPSEDDAIVSGARAKIADMKRQVLEVEADAHQREGERNALARLVAHVLDFVGSVPIDKALKSITRPPAKLQRGESHVAAIERCRNRVAELKAQKVDVETAPLPSAEAKQRATADIDAHAVAGAPQVWPLFEGERLRWPEKSTRFTTTTGIGSVETVDTLALFAFIHRDVLVAAVHRLIDAEADDAKALSAEDRKAALAKLDGQIEDTERDECDFIEQAAKAGIAVAYREDTAVHALLGLSHELTSVPQKSPAPRMTNTSREPATAPQHPSSLPTPAMRDEIWQ
jgi:hypothetical protein